MVGHSTDLTGDDHHVRPQGLAARHGGEDDFLARASVIGEQTEKAINKLLASKAFIEQTYDGCLGVLRLAEKYGNDRLEAACRRANAGSRINYKTLNNILKNNLDKIPLDGNEITLTIPAHENIRGAEAYY